jgi:hypothetical protein
LQKVERKAQMQDAKLEQICSKKMGTESKFKLYGVNCFMKSTPGHQLSTLFTALLLVSDSPEKS